MENQQKLPRRVGFGQERSVPFDWRDKTEQVATDLALDDDVRAQPTSLLERTLGPSRSTNEQTRSIAKPSTFERDRGAADARAKNFNARADDKPEEKQRGLADYLLSLNRREQRDNAYIQDGLHSNKLAFGHSNRGKTGLRTDFASAERAAKRGGPGAAEASEQMAIISSSEGDQDNKERQAKALGYGDAGRGMVSYDLGSSQYFGRTRREQAVKDGQGPTQGAVVQRANANRGILSRMFDSFARWMPGLGRLFGEGRDTKFSAAPGQEANRILAKRTQGEQLRGQRSAPMFSMSRLFGVSRDTGSPGAVSPQIEAANVPDSTQLNSEKGGPGIPLMEPTPARALYGRGDERRPLGYTPNSAWMVPAHGQAPSELIGTNRGVGKSGNVPTDALKGLESARQIAAALPRRGDKDSRRIEERKAKMSGAVADLDSVRPKHQYRAPYRLLRRGEEAKAALGAHSVIGEASVEDEEVDR